MIRRRHPLKRTPLRRRWYSDSRKRILAQRQRKKLGLLGKIGTGRGHEPNGESKRWNHSLMPRPEMVCDATGERKPLDGHHIITRGAGGCQCRENALWLTRDAHIEIHSIGTKTFCYKKYAHLAERLNDAYAHRNLRNRRPSPLRCSPNYRGTITQQGGNDVTGKSDSV